MANLTVASNRPIYVFDHPEDSNFSKLKTNALCSDICLLIFQEMINSYDFISLDACSRSCSFWRNQIKPNDLVELTFLKIFQKAFGLEETSINISLNLNSLNSHQKDFLFNKVCFTDLETFTQLFIETNNSVSNSLIDENFFKNLKFRTVKLLLKDKTTDHNFNETPYIYKLLESDQVKLAQLLIQDGRFTPSILSGRIWNPLVFTCYKDFRETSALLLKDGRTDPTLEGNLIFREACKEGKLEIVKILLNDSRVNPADWENEAVINACIMGHLEIVKLLLTYENINPFANNSIALITACEKGYFEIVELLLNDHRFDPSVYFDSINKAISKAYQNHHQDIVNLIIKDHRIVPSILAVEKAIENGDLKTIDLLLQNPHFKPSTSKNLVLRIAAENGHLEVVEKLLQHNRIKFTDEMVDIANQAAKNRYFEIEKRIRNFVSIHHKASILNFCLYPFKKIAAFFSWINLGIKNSFKKLKEIF